MKAIHVPHFRRRALAVITAVCLSALMIPLAASYAAAQDNSPVEYQHVYSTQQGTNGFYYVYAPANEAGVPEYANRQLMENTADLEYRDNGWVVPRSVAAADPGWISGWNDVIPSAAYALGVEFRAPAAGNYSLEAVIAGGDTTVKAGVDKTWGDGQLVEVVVNGSAVYTFDTNDWYGYSDNAEEWKLEGREIRKYVPLNEGDTAALYVYAKDNTAFDEVYFQYTVCRYPAVEYEDTYSFSYQKDYTGTAYSMTYVPYEGDFAPHAFDNFDLANEVDMVNMDGEGNRSSWVRPGAAHWLDAPFYHDWGEMGAGTGGLIGYQFTAPSKGVYDILHTISNGDTAADTDFNGGDGSEFYLYKNTDQRLFYWDCDNWRGTSGKEQQVINRISLNKGDTVTLYVFGKASGAFDNIGVGVSASKIPAKTVPVEDPQVGEGAESYPYGCATAQGNNNFYYVYAPVSDGVPNYAGLY